MPGNCNIWVDCRVNYQFPNLCVIIFTEKVRLANIHEAVRYGDVLKLQSMVQRGAGINDVDSKFKFTPLHWAAHHGSLEVRVVPNSL